MKVKIRKSDILSEIQMRVKRNKLKLFMKLFPDQIFQFHQTSLSNG